MPVLTQYRSLLKLVKHNVCLCCSSSSKYGSVNGNAMWKNEIVKQFRANRGERDAVKVAALLADASNLATYLDGVKMHRIYSDAYFSVSTLSGFEKLKRTAGVVGFALPKVYDAENPHEL